MSGCMADQFYQSGRNRQGETVQLRNLDYVMGNYGGRESATCPDWKRFSHEESIPVRAISVSRA